MCKLVEHLQRFIHSSFAHILCLMEFWGYQVWSSDKRESLHINQQRHESSVLESRRSKLPSVVLRRPDPADLQQGLPVQQRTTHSQIHAYLLPLWPRSWSWTTWFPGKPFVSPFGIFFMVFCTCKIFASTNFNLLWIQAEDKYTYNFRWYTSYACPERPHECLVTDPNTLDQYDLSR